MDLTRRHLGALGIGAVATALTACGDGGKSGTGLGLGLKQRRDWFVCLEQEGDYETDAGTQSPVLLLLNMRTGRYDTVSLTAYLDNPRMVSADRQWTVQPKETSSSESSDSSSGGTSVPSDLTELQLVSIAEVSKTAPKPIDMHALLNNPEVEVTDWMFHPTDPDNLLWAYDPARGEYGEAAQAQIVHGALSITEMKIVDKQTVDVPVSQGGNWEAQYHWDKRTGAFKATQDPEYNETGDPAYADRPQHYKAVTTYDAVPDDMVSGEVTSEDHTVVQTPDGTWYAFGFSSGSLRILRADKGTKTWKPVPHQPTPATSGATRVTLALPPAS